jgi:hypothetical protein
MLDFNNSQRRIGIVNQEDRALLRSNPSVWLMPEDGREHMVKYMLLSSCPSFGYKAINLLSRCSAPTKAKHIKSSTPVGHMSVLTIRCSKISTYCIIRSYKYSESALTNQLTNRSGKTIERGTIRCCKTVEN